MKKPVIKQLLQNLGPRLIRTGFEKLGPVMPGLIARYAYNLWCKTRRFAKKPIERQWLQQARCIRLKDKKNSIYGYEWGSGNHTILLIHGWNGRSSQMGAFGLALADLGYCAVAVDLPGHGKTPGSKTNMYDMAMAIEAVAQSYENVRGIITHSFGAFPVAWLLREGLSVDRIVCIAAPSNMAYLMDKFCEAMHISSLVQEKLRQLVEKKFGREVWNDVSADYNMAKLIVPGLIIHDKDDPDVPCAHAQILANAWSGSQLYLTTGLGHRKILRDPIVIKKAIDYVSRNYES